MKINKICHCLILFSLGFLLFSSDNAFSAYDSYGYKYGCGYNSVGPSTNPANYDQCIKHSMGSGSGSWCEKTAASAGITSAGCGGWRIPPTASTFKDSAGNTVCKFACNVGNTSDRNFVIASAAPTCTSCSSWSTCSGGSQYCTAKSPAGCTGGSFATTRSCGTPGSCNNSSAYACSSGYAINKYQSGNYYQWNCASYNGGATSGTCSYTASITCTSCSSWSTCSGGSQSCTAKSPAGCTGGSFPTTRSCGTTGVCNNSVVYGCSYGSATSKYDFNPTYYWWCASYDGGANSPQCTITVSPTCTSCSSWSTCSGGSQSCTAKSPAGCTGGSFPTTRSCGTPGSCNNSSAYACSSGYAINKYQSGNYYQWNCASYNGGTTSGTCSYSVSTPTCTSCSSWSTCSGGSQYCTAKSPAGCTGGSFATTRSCGSTGICNNSYAYGCTVGTAYSQYKSGNTYYWYCSGVDGGLNSGQCSYTSSPAPVNGACNNSCKYCCSSGTLGTTYDYNPTYYWYCNGTNGGSSSGLCMITIATPVNGQCGSAYGGSFSSAPTSGLCNQGSPSSPYQSGNYWVWSCSGSNGGSTATCIAYKTASPVNGVCNNSCKYCCSAGTLGTTYDYNPTYFWYCNGTNGGSGSSLCMITLSNPCTSCGSWTTCSNGTRTCTSLLPSGCSGGSVPMTQSCGTPGVCNNSSAYACSSGYAINQANTGVSFRWNCASYDGGTTSGLCNYNLSTPSSLTCSGASASQVNCSWTGSSGATSYELQRDYSTVGSPSSTSYSDSSLSCGTSYSYRVRACIGSVCSSWSNSSSALTYACNPTSLVCSGLSGTRIQCSWGQAPNTVNSYQLNRKRLIDTSFVTIQNSASRTYSNNDHNCGTIYSYRVRACNASGCSGYISYNAMTNACPACGAAEGQKTMIKPAQSLLCTPATVTISDITLVKNQWTWRCGIGAEDGPPVNCEAPRSNPLIIEP